MGSERSMAPAKKRGSTAGHSRGGKSSRVEADMGVEVGESECEEEGVGAAVGKDEEECSDPQPAPPEAPTSAQPTSKFSNTIGDDDWSDWDEDVSQEELDRQAAERREKEAKGGGAKKAAGLAPKSKGKTPEDKGNKAKARNGERVPLAPEQRKNA